MNLFPSFPIAYKSSENRPWCSKETFNGFDDLGLKVVVVAHNSYQGAL